MSDEIYRKLAKVLDTLPNGFPASESGVEIKLLKKIFEIDPLLCPRCHVPLQLVSVITEPKVVDRILAHRRRKPAEERELFGERAPPGERATSYASEYRERS